MKKRRPKIICLCGSTRFREQFDSIAEALTIDGHVVLMPNVWCRLSDDTPLKQKLDALHKAKIRFSDAILVVNVDGYIGKSTASEIDFANIEGKEIMLLES